MNHQKTEQIITAFNGKRIGVVGDLMLDVYTWGKAARISPEAPVPVVQVRKTTRCLGGAANVMRNIVTLGGRADAFGVIGDDPNGRTVRQLLAEYDIDPRGVCCDPHRRTTEKQRVIAASQQLLRIDYEDTEAVTDTVRREITSSLLELIAARQLDAIVFEDYAKGLLDRTMVQTITDAARRVGIIVALDPNPKHQMQIQNLTVMKPNRQEAFGLAGKIAEDSNLPPMQDPELREVAAILMAQWHPDYLLISLAADGMALFDRNADMTIIPTMAREVFDVSGAGDTVIATFTLALAAGADGITAARIANHAAGIVVGKIGTAPVTREELLESLKHGK
ncbi:MAG: PfkB family carbohydrate kinase [Victivallales bacterium]|nr:PfkB family carbohydrate kinase [Victivallales bacterium]